ncbi:MAG: polyisoprenoid-binding protein [Caulobacteraceae bacterium]|nr:polyisoprenoid-binding protein [Caulobacteraceae bacterium]
MTVRTMALGLAAAGVLAGALGASAQPAMPKPSKDYKVAPAGAYALDPAHTALIARVPHVGFSYSVFRFTAVSGELVWDPANPAADKLNVTVEAKSITTAPTGAVNFPEELSGAPFLNVAQFPTATFVSKAFHALDATHGKVDGDLTIKGKTTPATFDVELVGAGQGFRGPVIGVSARTTIDASGLGLPPMLAAPIELLIDTEFDKKG